MSIYQVGTFQGFSLPFILKGAGLFVKDCSRNGLKFLQILRSCNCRQLQQCPILQAVLSVITAQKMKSINSSIVFILVFIMKYITF